jgi:hypothetical protein
MAQKRSETVAPTTGGPVTGLAGDMTNAEIEVALAAYTRSRAEGESPENAAAKAATAVNVGRLPS